jgi:hopanoid biosynthesis associated protein HpnK
VRRQLAAEIRAQFEAFSASGLKLDHVNAHKHFHLHPTVLSLILKIGKDYGLRAIRLPREHHSPLWLRPWLNLMQRRLHAAGIGYNDHVFGITQSGRMNEAALLETIALMPAGLTEIYLHPATCAGREIAATMHGYRHDEELAALLSLQVRKALDDKGVARGGFADFG